MTIVEAPQETHTIYVGRARAAAAAALVVGPALMMLSSVAAVWVERSAPRKDDLAAAVAAPTPAAVGSLLDMLSVPAMLAFAVVVFQVTRRWSPRAAWIGTVAMVLQLCGLQRSSGSSCCPLFSPSMASTRC